MVLAVLADAVPHQVVLQVTLFYEDFTAQVARRRTVVILLVLQHRPNGLAEGVALVALNLSLYAVHGVQVSGVVERALGDGAADLAGHRRLLPLLSDLLPQDLLSVDFDFFAFEHFVVVVVPVDADLLLSKL